MLIPNKIVHFNNICPTYALYFTFPTIIDLAIIGFSPTKSIKKEQGNLKGCPACVYPFVTIITRHAM